MARPRRTFTRDFKLALLAQVESGTPLVQVARENGIHPTLMMKWKKDHRENPDKAFSGHGNPYKERAKLAEMERLVGQLYAENDFLKKALERLGSRVNEERLKNGNGSGSK
jgi:transposase-like protein